MGNRCCNKIPVQEQNGRKGKKSILNFFPPNKCDNYLLLKFYNLILILFLPFMFLVSGVGDSLSPVLRNNDALFMSSGTTRLPQDIIRQPNHSPMRPVNTSRLVSPNGILPKNILGLHFSFLNSFLLHFRLDN